MAATISGDGTSTLINLTTSGNTILGDASTDTLNVGNGGLVKDASGNVGIGTASPAAPLDVVTNSSANGISLRGRSSDAVSDFSLKSNDGASVYAQIQGRSTDLRIASNSTLPTLFFTNSTERMRIDSSGNVGIGTSSPVSKLDVQTGTGDDSANSTLTIRSSGNQRLDFYNNWSTATGVRARIESDADSISQLYGTLKFYTTQNSTVGVTERMRITSGGNLLVGTTSVNFAGSGFTLSTNSGTTKWLVGPISGTAGNFYIASSGTTGVYLNGTGATSWSSNSDERLKTDLKPIENAAEKVASLRAVTGRYKTDEEGYSRAFLIAQDVQAVLPEAVAPTTMYDGTEVLGLAYTETIPLLVAAIKEQQAIITQLQADVEALKAQP